MSTLTNNQETERKFLIIGELPIENINPINIVQGYLCSEKNHIVRVRIADDKGFLTIKGPNGNDGFSHCEIEKELPLEEAEELLKLCEPGIIKKKRYNIPCSDGIHTFEVDVYGGANAGLILAEIELRGEDEVFEIPWWLGQEVSDDYRYSNSELKKREVEHPRKEIVYIDMDGVLVDFESGLAKAEPYFRERYKKNPDYIPGVFNLMEPMPGAIEAVKILSEKYDLYILSTASWNNPLSWMEKRQWVGRYFGEIFHKKLILSHHKELNIGDYLIDDRDRNGASEFTGELIPFGSSKFPDWPSVVEYLSDK